MTYAERCLAIARTVSDREDRITLRIMAAEWIKVASTFGSKQSAEQPAE
jgi:hypothetical protein